MLGAAGLASAQEPAPPPVARMAPEEPRPPPSPDAHARRIRVTRNLALGSAALTVTAAVIGGPLVTVGNEQDKRAVLIGGATVLGIGGAALISTCVSFGLWLYERRH
jgi:hypothetical protein